MKKIILSLAVLFTSCMKVTVTSSDVASKITRLNREMTQVKADLALAKQIKHSINSDKNSLLYKNNFKDFGSYDIKIIEGRVLLTGAVCNEEIKRYIVNKITENLKVRELLDELMISRESPSKFSDFMIKRSINTKIFVTTKIKSLNYEITVFNGYVYIIGIASDEDELELVTKSISTVKGVKKVISYIITVDSDKKIKLEFL